MFGMDYSWTVVIAGVLLSICVALVVIGGIKRISSVSQVVVPFMAVAYVVVVLIILLTHLERFRERSGQLLRVRLVCGQQQVERWELY